MSTGDSSAATDALDTRPPPDASSKDASAPGPGSRSVSPLPEPTTAVPFDGNIQSQPMTATGSSSSLPPPFENGDNAASGYGTRSRNRTGGARPNYAEDKELDLEIEALSKPSRASKRSSGVAQEVQAAPAGFASVNGGASSDKVIESVPAPATAQAPATAPSKKRKHPGSSTTVTTASTSAGTSRTKATVSLPFKGYVETNMMSFTQCGYRLNAKRQLVADDGTAIQANGKLDTLCNKF